jgi:hypothetical protein
VASNFPTTAVPGRLKELLSRLPQMGVPDKATQKWLISAGYAGGNAMTILPVLRFVGVIASDGSPTGLWHALRRGDEEGRAEFANAIRQAYADLFAVHPDAHRRDSEALRNFFRAHTTGGEKTQQRLVQTFRTLAEFGDFDSAAISAPTRSREDHQRRTESTAITVSPRASSVPTAPELTLNVNLQLQLPATADADVYDKLFSAMRKHLMGLTDED